MATVSIVAAACVSVGLSAWYPWYWTKRWGENGLPCCRATGGPLSCRWDCGWYQDTFHEVDAITLKRDRNRDRATMRDPHLQEWHDCSGIPLDMGVRGHDIVSEQYASSMKIEILPGGIVFNPTSSAAEDAERATAGGVVVADRLREGPSDDSRGRRAARLSRLTRIKGALRLPDTIRLGAQSETPPRPSTTTDETEQPPQSVAGRPIMHD